MIGLVVHVYGFGWIAAPVGIVAWLAVGVVVALGVAGMIRNRDRQTSQDQAAETEPGGLIAVPDADDDEVST